MKHICILNAHLWNSLWILWGFPGDSDDKESACHAGDRDLIPGEGKIPWKREWQPPPVFLPGEFYGQSSLVSYCPWDHKELDECYWGYKSGNSLKKLHTIFKVSRLTDSSD